MTVLLFEEAMPAVSASLIMLLMKSMVKTTKIHTLPSNSPQNMLICFLNSMTGTEKFNEKYGEKFE